MFDPQDIKDLANKQMPFGKYIGRRLIDLPEEYLLWFSHKGFPSGRIGFLLQLALEMHIHGLTSIVTPLKQPLSDKQRLIENAQTKRASPTKINFE